jgi:hypothetical protein
MRRILWLAATAALFVFPVTGLCRQQGQQSSSPAQSQAQKPPAAPPEDSLAAAARRAREQKKDAPKSGKVFDNDNLPSEGGISSVGAASPAGGQEGASAPAESATSSANDESAWRDRFAKLRHKLEQDQADLEVMQRELGVLNVQFYNDPVKGLQQGLTRSDINKKTANIEAKKKQVEADKQAISDAEDDLRKAGGDPGWAR